MIITVKVLASLINVLKKLLGVQSGFFGHNYNRGFFLPDFCIHKEIPAMEKYFGESFMNNG